MNIEEKRRKGRERMRLWRLIPANLEKARAGDRDRRRALFRNSEEYRRKKAARDKAWRTANPKKAAAIAWRRHIRQFYKLEPEDFAALLSEQHGRCAICERPLDSSSQKFVPHVDHDHATGKVRGLLCKTCNAGVGFFEDGDGLLMKAQAYLAKHARDESKSVCARDAPACRREA